MAKKTETEITEVTEAKEIDMEELVDFYEPATRGEASDIFVSVNGRNMQIQRGKQVKIPRWAFEVLQNQRAMDSLALERSNELQNQ